ncbi:MAG TPA: histidine kinase dimerization/phospho-acceptor domain-containing protein, partial [Planctomycetota bacterium]|nr:histidine kinase dimerization/phospho-acceptor domain-containing protein [Planctomycetota bacterium]
MIGASERVLILAPRGRDAALLADALRKAQREPQVLGGMADLRGQLDHGACALILEEEAINPGTAAELLGTLSHQPPWSDLPVILLSSPVRVERQTRALVRNLGRSANVVLLERPIRILTLLQAVESASRARRRQYEVRDFQTTLEESVRERTASLEATLKEMDAFSYTIAHDLRAPLRHLSRFSEALDLECGAALTSDCGGYLREIRAVASRMDTLVQDILRYSRLTRAEITLRPLEPAEVVQRVLSDMADELRGSQARIATEIGPGPVSADPFMLSQALTNLVSNAVKFVPPGALPSVLIRREDRGDAVRIWVEDNGIGIAER